MTNQPRLPGNADAKADDSGIDVARGRDLTVRFNGKRCVHARSCVLGAPTVFRANTPGEWIFPDEMGTEDLVRVVENCPSGALTYERKDDRAPEAAPSVNVVRVREDGPYAFNASIDLDGAPTRLRVALCRCGASKDKPYCDNAHLDIAFKATGEPESRESKPLEVRDGTLTIEPTTDGPLEVSGNLEICSGTGRTIDRVTKTWLCRCGASQTKPFCDGSHNKIGFRSD